MLRNRALGLLSVLMCLGLLIWTGCQEQLGGWLGKSGSPDAVQAGGESSRGQAEVRPAGGGSTSDSAGLIESAASDGPAHHAGPQIKEEGAAEGPSLGNPASGGPLSQAAPTPPSPPYQGGVEIRNVAAPLGEDYSAKKPIDPVTVNGQIFEDWPKPKLVIVISGQQNGYLEPCGCAGLENMKGGLMRRHSFLKSLTAKDGFGWPAVVALDLGNLVRRYGWQANHQYETATKALKIMNYDAIGFGPDDLKLGIDPLLSAAADEDTSRFVAANVGLLGWDESPTVRYRVIERGGFKIGVTAILGETYRKTVADAQIVRKDAKAGLREVLPKLQAERCNLLILLSYATVEESKKLAKEFKEFDIVVTADGADEPPFAPENVAGAADRWLVETGKKGMYVNVIGLYDDAKTRRFQRVPVDSRFTDSPEVKRLMVDLQGKYKQYFLRFGWKGMGIAPQPHHTGRQFVGSETCGGCHTKAFAIWQGTPHAHATDTLAKLDVPRQFDAECVSCHATGWEPQKYFPYRSGYDSMKKTPHLAHNGCENCHGPGSLHVAIEEGQLKATPAERRAAREQMRVTLAEAKTRTCAACHDLDNSPDYIKKGFEAYWPKVQHKGKD